MSKFEKTFAGGNPLKADELNQMVASINDNDDKIASLREDTNTKLTELESIKLDKKDGFNLVNPDEIEYYKYILPNGQIGGYGGKSLAVSGYIKVNGKNIATNAKVSSNVGSVNVYDVNKELLRTLSSAQYVYQDGDYYIRFTINEADKESNRMANYGSVLSPYIPYNPIGGYLSNINGEILNNKKDIELSVKSESQNLVNLDDVEFHYYLEKDGEKTYYGGTGLALSGFIFVNGKDIITNAKEDSESVCAITVYNSNKQKIRTIPSSKQYTYQDGDFYIRFTIPEPFIVENCRANYGTTLFPYSKFNPIKPYTESKLEKNYGFNLVNPDEIEYYKYILSNGEIGDYGGKSLALSGYIKVNGKNIATNAKVSSNVGSVNVYDVNKELLRTLSSAQYVYQDGDYYIRFTINEADKESNRMANYGDILFQYYPYSEIDGYIFGSEPKHRVLWVGTSIPEGTPYPQNACRNLGYICYNKSLGSSRITIGEGTDYSKIAGIGLAESSQEKAIRYAAWETGTPEEQAQYKKMMDWGYDKRIIPYIDGTIDTCDYVVIDHGINDRNAQFATMIENFNSLDLSIVKDDSDYDRNNFVEAFCFIVKKIWQVNPKVRILVCSYLENKTGSPEYPNDVQGRMGYQVCELLKRIAGHFDFPYLNQCDYLGFGVELMPGTSNFLSNYNATYGTSYTYRNFTGESNPNSDISRFQYYCPDGLHPHTDKQGVALPILESVMTKLLRDL